MAKRKPRGAPFTKGNEVSKGNAGFPGGALLEQHVQQVFQRMATERDGLVAIWAWCDAQGWARGHTATVLRQVRHLMRGVTQEKAEDTRARLLAFIEKELATNCTEYVTGTGEGVGAGTVVMKHPKTGEILTRRNHAAVQGYLKLVMRITGIDKLVVEHRTGQRPHRDWSTQELRDELARLEEAAADQATAVEATPHDEGESDGP